MTPSAAALIAATRFGFVPRGGDLAAIAPDPRGWVLRQMTSPPRPLGGDLPTAADMVARTFAAQRDKRAPEDRKEFNQQMREVYLAEIGARIAGAAESTTPLAERLTQFWSNHFTVSALRPVIHGFAGAFEREAIRPHVFGRFPDMLLAAESHPAMLLYLDNAISIGPDFARRHAAGEGAQRESRPRDSSSCTRWASMAAIRQADVEALGAHPHRLVGGAAQRSRAGQFQILRADARARHENPARQALRRGGPRRGRGGAARPGAASGDGAPHRGEARAPLHCRRAAARCGRAHRHRLPRQRRRSRAA